jgi:hypothetical protein
MTEKTTTTPTAEQPSAADETFGWTGDDGNGGTGKTESSPRDWLAQLQTMIENVTEQAGPVLREVSAKAAELAAVAGEKAGPIAARAAEFTAEAGSKLAERSRDLAAELRRDQAAHGESGAAQEPVAAPSGDDAKG